MEQDNIKYYWCYICQKKISSNCQLKECPFCEQSAFEQINNQNNPQQFEVYIPKNNINTNRNRNNNIQFIHPLVHFQTFIRRTNQLFDQLITQMNRRGENYLPATVEQIKRLQQIRNIKQCTICQSIQQGTSGLKLGCGHCFHRECILPWLQRANTCPTCRYKLI